MPELSTPLRIRPLDELDIGSIVRIDERVGGTYRPDYWEGRVMFYLRRDPQASQVAVSDGKVVGFMLADVRAGEFGLEEPSGWIERFGIDPDYRGRDIGRALFQAIAAHFRAMGVAKIRTLAIQSDAVSGFLTKLGFAPAPLVALEMMVPADREQR
ncbi:MAG: GNAT family N-acetyltransferase [Candidatus Eisenbacteria bacterium]|nr:GNAT family N-acetyltransferase [Candidatus Eisenbacteria bacterium]